MGATSLGPDKCAIYATNNRPNYLLLAKQPTPFLGSFQRRDYGGHVNSGVLKAPPHLLREHVFSRHLIRVDKQKLGKSLRAIFGRRAFASVVSRY